MAVTAGSRKPVLLAPVHCAPKALSSPSASNCPSLHHCERGSPMKNRKREICTSGSVRDEDGQPPHLLGRRYFLHLAAGAAALPVLSRFAWAQAYPTRPVRIIVGFPGGSAAMSPFSQQLMYRGWEHEPLPLLLSFSHGDSEMRGERYESRLEPSPRTRGYGTFRPTRGLCPARRPANCQRAKAVR